MKTSIPSWEQSKDKKWFVVDAEGKVLGKLATKIANVLRGKHKPTFTPHMDMGDHVIVLNAGKVKITGAKLDQKYYYTHSGYPGHLKFMSVRTTLEKKPLMVLKEAVVGMLPKNKLRVDFMKKLHLYEGAEHKHEAQSPTELKI